MHFSIMEGSNIHMGCNFDSKGGFSVGANTVINPRCRVDTRGSITIGNNVSISNEVTILTADHDPNSQSFEGRQKCVIIEDYVWVGTRAMIMPGVRLGRGSVIAAGSIVTKDVLPNEVVAGIPAKFIKNRDVIEFNYVISYARLFQ